MTVALPVIIHRAGALCRTSVLCSKYGAGGSSQLKAYRTVCLQGGFQRNQPQMCAVGLPRSLSCWPSYRRNGHKPPCQRRSAFCCHADVLLTLTGTPISLKLFIIYCKRQCDDTLGSAGPQPFISSSRRQSCCVDTSRNDRNTSTITG